MTASGITQNNAAVPTDGLASLSYNRPSNRINTQGYEYDLAGNLTRGQDSAGNWQRYDYDTAGRLTRVWNDARSYIQQDNAYGASRQRELSWSYASANLTFYLWGGSSVIAEYTGTFDVNVPLAWTKSYIYAGSRLLSTYTNNNGTEVQEFQHPDRLGTKLVTNDVSNTNFEQSTLPFGTSLDAESTGATNQRFTSYDRSTTASLDYAVNRSYSAGQGRFTSVDPLGAGATSIGNPQSNNLYAYVGNNPIDYTDPSGLLKIEQCTRYWVDFGDGEGRHYTSWTCTTIYDDGGGGDSGGGGGGGSEKPKLNTGPKAVFSKDKLTECLGKSGITIKSIGFDRFSGGDFSGTYHDVFGDISL